MGAMVTKEEIIEVIKQCYDPEIPVNIWDLGLIYDIHLDSQAESTDIRMTLTSQGCPSAREIPMMLKSKLEDQLKLKAVEIEVTFDPPWTPERISEEGKKKLGLDV